MTPQALRITSVKPGKAMSLHVTFTNRETRALDVARWLTAQPKKSPAHGLSAPGAVADATVADWGHTLEWPALDYSLDAERVYEITLEQAGCDDAVVFRRWQERNQLSLASAADALGMTRRMIANYRMGKARVPRTVLLALKGWEAERAHAA